MKAASFFLMVAFITAFPGCSDEPGKNKIPDEQAQLSLDTSLFHKVKPVLKKVKDMHPIAQQPAPQQELQIRRGNFFSYALPPGWRVGEDGQFAITLVSQDTKAMTVMVGNAGLLPNYPPSQFVYEKMQALRPYSLQFGQGTRTTPVTGFQEAYVFPVTYQLQNGYYKGEVTCHVANYYGGCVMAMTAALAEASQWPVYAGWLPQVSRQMSAINGAAFGMRGIMQQNLQNSMAFAEAARSYREWSQQNWQRVTDERNQSEDRRQYQFREALGGIETYSNPYNNQTPVELSNQYKYYWANPYGEIVGTNDPGVNPNDGNTIEWKRMERKEQP